MSAPECTYRDATFSQATRDVLARLLDGSWALTTVERAALEDVVSRWDGNEATEFVEAFIGDAA